MSSGVDEMMVDSDQVQEQTSSEVTSTNSESSGSSSKFQNLVNECKTKIYTLDDLPTLLEEIRSEDLHKQYNGVIGIRKLLCKDQDLPIQQVIEANLVPVLMRFLKMPVVEIQFESAWALTNNAGGNSQQTRVVIEHGGISAFLGLVLSPSEDVSDQAVWALGNIAGDCAEFRDMILEEKGLPLIIKAYEKATKITTKRNAMWTISNCCRLKPAPQLELVKCALPLLKTTIEKEEDVDILVDALWALSYISDGDNDRIQTVIDSGVVPHLITRLDSTELKVLVPALRTVGNITLGDDKQTEILLSFSNLVGTLMRLAQHSKQSIKKEALWTLSNITAGNEHQIETVTSSVVNIQQLINSCLNEKTDIAREATYVLANACSGGTSEQVKRLVNEGVIECFGSMLQKENIVLVALEGLEAILRTGETENSETNPYATRMEEKGIIDYIEKLQEHPNDQVYQKALGILETYFSDENEEDAGVGSDVDGNENGSEDNQEGQEVEVDQPERDN